MGTHRAFYKVPGYLYGNRLLATRIECQAIKSGAWENSDRVPGDLMEVRRGAIEFQVICGSEGQVISSRWSGATANGVPGNLCTNSPGVRRRLSARQSDAVRGGIPIEFQVI